MKKEGFIIELLSDIVLQATSNNEGKIENLDFIPGSATLGIVANDYQKFNNSFEVFHSGVVRFGDATILIDNKKSYKMPLSLFHKKNDKSKLFNHHKLNDNDFKTLGQLKQKRSGFINEDLDIFEIEYNYAQKSAYDKKKRRSKDSAMFGYNALEKGNRFYFEIEYQDGIDIEKIKNSLLGKRRLGKSKSAEYGLIEIKEHSLINNNENLDNPTILYAKSRLALFDKNGYPTLDVENILDGIEVNYEKTQIKSSSFTPFNKAREVKDYERVVINSGSVIVLKKPLTQKQIEQIKKRVGGYLSEGFGEILINPSFLDMKEFEYKKIENKESYKSQNQNSKTVKFLQNRKKDEYELIELIKRSDEFLERNRSLYRDISKSAWGRVRAILNSNSENFLEEIEEYISSGIKKWDKKQIDIFLENKDKKFLEMIAIKMQRIAK